MDGPLTTEVFALVATVKTISAETDGYSVTLRYNAANGFERSLQLYFDEPDAARMLLVGETVTLAVVTA